MQHDGFEALLVAPDSAEECTAALRQALVAHDRQGMGARNVAYMERHEDHRKQLDEIWTAVQAVCRRYYGAGSDEEQAGVGRST
jgi:hypothetical protein